MAEAACLSSRNDTPVKARTSGPVTALDLLRSNGYVILDRLLPEETVDRVADELEVWFESAARCKGSSNDSYATCLNWVLYKSTTSHTLAMHPVMLRIADAVLRPRCECYRLTLTQAVRVNPGRRQQVPHRDEEMRENQKAAAEYLINVMWALSDFTAENGATMVWPRSHFNDLLRRADPTEAVIAEMRRGSALVYLGSVVHCGGANCSFRPRTGLVMSYCPGCLNQSDSSFRYPPAVAKTFPEMLRRLIGYRMQRPDLVNLRSPTSLESL